MPEIKDSSTNMSNVTQAHEVPCDQEFYLIGIGGAGMSVLALLLHDLGYHVSGSDQVQADTLGQLREAASQFLWDTGRNRSPLTLLWW